LINATAAVIEEVSNMREMAQPIIELKALIGTLKVLGNTALAAKLHRIAHEIQLNSEVTMGEASHDKLRLIRQPVRELASLANSLAFEGHTSLAKQLSRILHAIRGAREGLAGY
jgi:hypothetical protein